MVKQAYEKKIESAREFRRRDGLQRSEEYFLFVDSLTAFSSFAFGPLESSFREPTIMREKYWHLLNRSLLDPLQPNFLRELERQCRIRNYEPGAALEPPQQLPGGILLVLEGEVKLIQATPLGRELTIATLEPGDIAGKVQGDNLLAYDDYLVCSQSALIAYVPPFAAHSLLNAASNSGGRVHKRIGLTRFRIELPLNKLFYHSTDRRLNELFGFLRARLGYQLPDYSTDVGVRLRLPELARIVGSSVAAVRRALGDMEATRALRYENSRVILTSRQAA